MNIDKSCYYVLFPITEIEEGSKVILYGAGTIAKCLLDQNQILNWCEIIAIVDQNSEKSNLNEIDIIKSDKLIDYEYDYILISPIQYNIEILESLKNMNIQRNKIILLEEKNILDPVISRSQSPYLASDYGLKYGWLDYYKQAEQDAAKAVDSIILPFCNKYSMLNKTDHVLDFACGHGRIANLMINNCNNLTCCDISPDAIEFCKKRFSDNQEISYCISSKENIPLGDEIFDFIYSWDAMVHFQFRELEDAIKEFYRILKTNAYVFIHHSNWRFAPENHHVVNGHSKIHWRSDISKADVAMIAEKNSFKIIEQIELDWGNTNGEYQKIDCLSIFKK